jgi:ATP-dependent DNA helicase MPH1
MSSDGFEFDDIDLGEIDAIESHYTNGTALPPRSAVNRPGLVQRDLFGAAVVPPPQKPQAKNTGGGGGGTTRTVTIGGPASRGGGTETKAKTKVTKRWDPAAFAKHGWSKKNAAVAKAKAKGKGKGKQKALGSDEEPWDEDEVLDDDDEDEEGTEYFVDTTYDPKAPILPIKWPPDPEASKSFVYPVQPDKPLRVYQYNIVTSALYKNTLVSLPTGLGKTFIAACVM